MMNNVNDSHFNAAIPVANHTIPLENHQESLPLFTNPDNYDRSDMIYLNHPSDVTNSDMWMDPNFCHSLVSKNVNLNSYPNPNLDLLGLLSSEIEMNGDQDHFGDFNSTMNQKNGNLTLKSGYSLAISDQSLPNLVRTDNLLHESNINSGNELPFPDNLINSTTDLSALECLNVLANDRDVPENGQWENINLISGSQGDVNQSNSYSHQNSSLTDFPDVVFAQMVEELPCYKCKFCPAIYITFSRDEMAQHLKTLHPKDFLLHLKQNSIPSQQSTPLPPWNTVTNVVVSSSLVVPSNCDNNQDHLNRNNGAPYQNGTNNLNAISQPQQQQTRAQQENAHCKKCSRAFFTFDELKKHQCQATTTTTESKLTSHLVPIAPKNGTIVNKPPSAPIAVKRKRPMTPLKKSSRDRQKAQQGCYICEFKGCNVRFRLLENLEYHCKCHANGKNGNVSFACPECTFECATWNSMAGHVWRRHSIDLELHACDQCSFRTYSLSKLENLHKRTHSLFRSYLCPKCNNGFKTYKLLWTHKKSCMDLKSTTPAKKKPRAHCDICNMSFCRSRLLSIHLESVHQNIRPYSCQVCGYAANRPTTLKMHMRQHSGEKPFACEFCNFRTADHNSLRRHNMTHSGEKPYKCSYCSYGCIQSTTFKAHLRKKHPDKNHGLMFTCKLCNYQTVNEQLLMVHAASHKPEENNSLGSTGTTASNSSASNQESQLGGAGGAPPSMADSQIMFEAVKCSIHHREIT